MLCFFCPIPMGGAPPFPLAPGAFGALGGWLITFLRFALSVSLIEELPHPTKGNANPTTNTKARVFTNLRPRRPEGLDPEFGAAGNTNGRSEQLPPRSHAHVAIRSRPNRATGR